MKNKKVFIIILVLIIISFIIFYIFFNKKETNNLNLGNNKSSQEIVDYILNISSYEATIEVDVKSNKNENKYILKQQYISPETSTQEVIEPSNIQGVKIIKQGKNLKLENTNLSLTSVFDNYEYVADNILDLNSFIEDYKNNSESKYEEKDDQIIMTTKTNNENKYIKNKILYINKKTAMPSKLEIKDANKNLMVYILYNEVKINSLNKQNIIAFKLYNMLEEI